MVNPQLFVLACFWNYLRQKYLMEKCKMTFKTFFFSLFRPHLSVCRGRERDYFTFIPYFP